MKSWPCIFLVNLLCLNFSTFLFVLYDSAIKMVCTNLWCCVGTYESYNGGAKWNLLIKWNLEMIIFLLVEKSEIVFSTMYIYIFFQKHLWHVLVFYWYNRFTYVCSTFCLVVQILAQPFWMKWKIYENFGCSPKVWVHKHWHLEELLCCLFPMRKYMDVLLCQIQESPRIWIWFRKIPSFDIFHS